LVLVPIPSGQRMGCTAPPADREQESLLPTYMTELIPVTYEVTPWKALRGITTYNGQQ